MPTLCFLSITGVNQGLITKGSGSTQSIGDTYIEGHEDQLLVQSVGHSINLPRDRQSGIVTGRRVHRPFKVTCEINK